jgi:hypothetical protein
MLEEPGALRELAVHAATRALPLLAHLAHRLVDQRGLGQRIAVADGEEGPLDRLVDEPAHPHLARAELLEDVERAGGRVGLGIPAAPGAVVVEVIAPPALLEDAVPRARPREFVAEDVGHGPQHSRESGSR